MKKAIYTLSNSGFLLIFVSLVLSCGSFIWDMYTKDEDSLENY